MAFVGAPRNSGVPLESSFAMRFGVVLGLALLALAPGVAAHADSLVWPMHGKSCSQDPRVSCEFAECAHCDFELWRADANGANARVIGSGAASRSGMRSTQWSRDGSRIVFHQSFDETPDTTDPVEGQEIFSMAGDGSDMRRLTSGGGTLDMQPAISPDGREIAWWRSGHDASIGFEVGGIWIMRADGSDQRRLVDLPGNESTPDFSADGKRVAFTRDRRRDRGVDIASVWSVRRDGTDLRQLSTGDLDARVPKFSPDGRYMSFFTGGGLLVVWLDGSQARFYEVSGNTAAWSSTGRYLAVLGSPPDPNGRASLWRIDTRRPQAPPVLVRDLSADFGGWLAYPSWIADDTRQPRSDKSAPSFVVALEKASGGSPARGSLRVVGGRRKQRPLTVRDPKQLRFAAADRSGLKRIDVSVTRPGAAARFRRVRSHRDWTRITRRLRRGRHSLRVRTRDDRRNVRRAARPLLLRVR